MIFYKSFIDPINLNDDLQLKAYNNLNETKEILLEKIIELRLLIENINENDRIKDISDDNLIRFLRNKKYRLNDCIEGIIKLQQFMIEHQVLFDIIDSNQFKQLVLPYIRDIFFIIQQKSNIRNNSIIVIIRPKILINIITNNPKLQELYPNFIVLCNLWLIRELSYDPHVQINGLIVFNTFHGISIFDQMKLSPYLKSNEILIGLQHLSILSIRLKGSFIFEQPYFMSIIFFFVKRFVSKKLAERLHLCGNNYDIIDEKLPDLDRNILPKLFGGKIEEDDEQLTFWIRQRISG